MRGEDTDIDKTDMTDRREFDRTMQRTRQDRRNERNGTSVNQVVELYRVCDDCDGSLTNIRWLHLFFIFSAYFLHAV